MGRPVTITPTQWAHHHDAVTDAELELYLEARVARWQAESWRDPPFRVGAAGLVVTHGSFYKRASGANYKPQKEGGLRFCAEERVMVRAREHGGTVIPGIVIVADHQPDDKSGLDLGVLIPCVHCRRKFLESVQLNGLVRPETRLVLVNATTHKFVRMTVHRLLRMCPVEEECSGS